MSKKKKTDLILGYGSLLIIILLSLGLYVLTTSDLGIGGIFIHGIIFILGLAFFGIIILAGIIIRIIEATKDKK